MSMEGQQMYTMAQAKEALGLATLEGQTREV